MHVCMSQPRYIHTRSFVFVEKVFYMRWVLATSYSLLSYIWDDFIFSVVLHMNIHFDQIEYVYIWNDLIFSIVLHMNIHFDQIEYVYIWNMWKHGSCVCVCKYVCMCLCVCIMYWYHCHTYVRMYWYVNISTHNYSCTGTPLIPPLHTYMYIYMCVFI